MAGKRISRQKLNNEIKKLPLTVDLSGSTLGKANGKGVDNDIYKAARVALIVTGGSGTAYTNSVTYLWSAEAETWYAFSAASDTYQELSSSTATNVTSASTVAATACQIVLPANPDNATAANIVNVEIVMWLEGQDTDCKNANAGGAFDVVLNFKKVAGN